MKVDGLQGDQSTLKEINPEYLLEGLMLKAEALIFLPPGVAVSLEKTLMLGKIEDKRRRGDR